MPPPAAAMPSTAQPPAPEMMSLAAATLPSAQPPAHPSAAASAPQPAAATQQPAQSVMVFIPPSGLATPALLRHFPHGRPLDPLCHSHHH